MMRLLIGLIPAVLFMLTSGCKKDDASYTLYFSHENHVNEYEVSCADCHGEQAEGRFTKPSHASCVDCHDDWIETSKITEKTCGQCHKARDLDALAELEAPEPSVAIGGSFVHTEATAKRCNECHGNLFGKKLYEVPELKRSGIVRIREQAHQWNMACDACHVDMDPETPPPSHDINWERRHGPAGMQTDNACSMCHSEQSCRECHQETMPDSHNNLWRLKTHGIEAAWDRNRCQVCHEEDSCTSCHEEVRPQSHRANWVRAHCDNCHLSSSAGTGCALCHETTIDDHPDPHPVGWINGHCRNCHNGTPQSEQCNICHPGAGIDNHPNPHSAGFVKSHCTSCHNNGRIDGVSCSACHEGDLYGEHPNPHSAGFANNHCTSCHARESINGVSCSKCHEGNLYRDHPNPHAPNFVNNHCNNCHAGSAVNGVSCAECHGGDVIDSHPNPHSAGFRRSHCNSCHAGSPASQQCEICHEGGSSVLVHEDFWPPVHDRFGDQANCSDCHF